MLHHLLTNWQKYLYAEDGTDPLIKLAVQHYQFEAIHPFTDGNGRAGRIINLLYLIDRGLLTAPVLYLSRYIINNKNDYYSKLLKVTTDHEWENWVLYFLEAVRETAKWTTKKILDIQALFDKMCSFIRKEAPNIYTKELVELLFIQPYVRISNVTEKGLAARETATKYLRRLCEIGVLEELKVGRDKLFLHRQFLELLKANNY